MKTIFFSAIAILAMHQAEAVSLQSHDFDFGDYDYELAQIDGEGKGDAVTESMGEGDESASGVNLKIAGAGAGDSACCPKPKLPFDQQMLLALQELSGKSMTLYDALKAQFAKSSALQNSKSMEVCGKICFDPVGDGPLPKPEEPEPCCPKPKDVTLSIKADEPCCPKKDEKKADDATPKPAGV